MIIYIIRHGETDLNAKGCIQGQVDYPLNENGRKLAALTGQGMKNIHFDAAISSPSSRAYETAEIVLRENTASDPIPIATDERLMETNWGAWEGLGCVESNYEVPREQHRVLWTDAFHFVPPEGAESAREVCDRTAAFYQELIRKPEYQDKTILLSTHGYAMRALLNPIYENPEDFWHGSVPKNCTVNIVEVKNGVSTLIGDDVLYYDPSLNNESYGVEA